MDSLPHDCATHICTFINDYQTLCNFRLALKTCIYSSRSELDRFIPKYIAKSKFHDIGKKGQHHIVEYLITEYGMYMVDVAKMILDGLCHCTNVSNVKTIIKLLCNIVPLSSRQEYHMYKKGVLTITPETTPSDKIFTECMARRDRDFYQYLVDNGIHPPSEAKIFFEDVHEIIATSHNLYSVVCSETKNLARICNRLPYSQDYSSHIISILVHKPYGTIDILKLLKKWISKESAQSVKVFFTDLLKRICLENIKPCSDMIPFIIQSSYKTHEVFVIFHNSIFGIMYPDFVPLRVANKLEKIHKQQLELQNDSSRELSREVKYINLCLRKYLKNYKVLPHPEYKKIINELIEHLSHSYTETVVEALHTEFFEDVFNLHMFYGGQEMMYTPLLNTALESEAVVEARQILDSSELSDDELMKLEKYHIRLDLLRKYGK